jgi:hypothetical protein
MQMSYEFELKQHIPDPDILLALEPEELAGSPADP